MVSTRKPEHKVSGESFCVGAAQHRQRSKSMLTGVFVWSPRCVRQTAAASSASREGSDSSSKISMTSYARGAPRAPKPGNAWSSARQELRRLPRRARPVALSEPRRPGWRIITSYGCPERERGVESSSPTFKAVPLFILCATVSTFSRPERPGAPVSPSRCKISDFASRGAGSPPGRTGTDH
jgi:hypothetical protein